MISNLERDGYDIRIFKANNHKAINEKTKARKLKEQSDQRINIPRPPSTNPSENLIINAKNVPLKPTKNIAQIRLMKRPCPGGMMFIDRVNEEDQDLINEYETIPGREVQNYMWDSFYSVDEKINQMRSIRCKGVQDLVCFDQEDDVIDNVLKSLNLQVNFKNFLKSNKLLKVE